mmetsp:Transcript_8103/g.18661  ORF Transcript_8103/g.18661 Transcript_8103/m.18661 type:complete len:210 (-) Transcript_8103:369-998(-)
MLHADDQCGLLGICEPGDEAGLAVCAGALHGEAVHGLGDPDHGVGVVVVHPLLALVHEVALYLKLVPQALHRSAVEAALAEALLPLPTRTVGDGAELPREAQAVGGQRPIVVVAVVEVRVRHDRLALGMPEGDAAGKTLCAGRDGNELADAVRICASGTDALHTAQRGPDGGVDLANTQVIEESELSGHLVEDLKTGEAAAVPPPVRVQ